MEDISNQKADSICCGFSIYCDKTHFQKECNLCTCYPTIIYLKPIAASLSRERSSLFCKLETGMDAAIKAYRMQDQERQGPGPPQQS